MPLPTTLTFTTTTNDRRPVQLPALKAKLRALGIFFKSTATKARCELLLARARRGLLSYDPCTAPELQKFVLERQIPCKQLPEQHTQLVRLLERADEERSFSRFLDLPPELRVMVYELALSSAGHLKQKTGGETAGAECSGRVRRAPAICLVSKLVAREAVPLVGGKVPGEGA